MPSEFNILEKKWQEFWQKEQIYAFNRTAKLPVFSVDTPPPTVSGRMHLGHAFSYTQADMVVRFKRMQGHNVFYPFGFDDNGLATERMVEKNLKIRGQDFPRQKFIQMCLDETRKTEQLLEEDFKSLGISVDWTNVYRTISKEAQKAAQLSFIEIFEQKRAYRQKAPTMWCPTCQTAIAQAELEDEEKEGQLVFIEFEVEDGKKITIATTRPEMLFACVAIYVHPDDERYKEFVGKKAKIPFITRWVNIYRNPDVKMDFGTGAVYHCTYGGQQDLEWSLSFQSTPIEIIEKNGRLNKNALQFEGLSISDARKKVVEELKALNMIKKIDPIKQVVNVHERCKTPVEIITSRQWFVKYLDLKKDFLKKGREIKWVPVHMRTRMENWISGLKWDWNVSRQRFYGVPFPVWYCKACGKTVLADKKNLPVDPTQDLPNKACPKCKGNEFEGERDVFDTWFTSSLTPQIALGWANSDKLFGKNFPMNLRVQAHDIINLWAFYTIVKAHLHEKKVPWKNIMISGHALDSRGRKMSKSLGNVIDPRKVIDDFSADILRYWAATAALGDDLPFQDKDLVSGKKFVQKLSNACRFVVGASEGFDQKTNAKKLKFRAVDKWIVQWLNETINECTSALEEYEFSQALNSARNFFWLEFADYYLEEAKYRIYGSDEDSKNAALFTLNTTMFSLLKLFAPFLPHVSEELCQTHFKSFLETKSVHTEKWPKKFEGFEDKKSLKAGKMLMEIISAVRKQKTVKKLAMNAPIQSVEVFGPKELETVLLELEKTMNVKEVSLFSGKGSLEVSKEVSLNLVF